MINYYNIIYKTYRNNKEVGKHHIQNLLPEDKATPKIINITWENLNDVYWNYGIVLPFNIWSSKRGRIISFWHFKLFDKNTWDINERRTKDLDLKLSIEYQPIKPTMRDLKNCEADIVLKYLEGVVCR